MPDANEDIETCLLERDGSARDMNFEAPTWPGLWDALRELRAEFSTARIGLTSDDTDSVRADDIESALQRVQVRGGAVQILLAGGHQLLSHLQLFVTDEAGASPFVELTFFPQDVLPRPGLEERFTTWLRGMQRTLGATRVYARYENASWRFGDVAFGSGVFFASE